jgi:hypothetical protein
MAFLHAQLKDNTMVAQPEGFVDEQHPDWVCTLHKSLYGLKQVCGGPIYWSSKFQSSVALSSTKAELTATSKATCQVIVMQVHVQLGLSLCMNIPSGCPPCNATPGQLVQFN